MDLGRPGRHRRGEVRPRADQLLDEPAADHRDREDADRPPGRLVADDAGEGHGHRGREPGRPGEEVADRHPTPVVLRGEPAAARRGVEDVADLADRSGERDGHPADNCRGRGEREAGGGERRSDEHAGDAEDEPRGGPDPCAQHGRGEVHERGEDRERHGAEQPDPGVRGAHPGPGLEHRPIADGGEAAERDPGGELDERGAVGERHDRMAARERVAQRRQRLDRDEHEPGEHGDRADAGQPAADDGDAGHDGGGAERQQEQRRRALERAARLRAGERDREMRHERADGDRGGAGEGEVDGGPRRAVAQDRGDGGHDGAGEQQPGRTETERQHVALGPAGACGPGGGGTAARHRCDLDQCPPSIGTPPSPALNRPRAPRPTKLKAWVTIG